MVVKSAEREPSKLELRARFVVCLALLPAQRVKCAALLMTELAEGNGKWEKGRRRREHRREKAENDLQVLIRFYLLIKFLYPGKALLAGWQQKPNEANEALKGWLVL